MSATTALTFYRVYYIDGDQRDYAGNIALTSTRARSVVNALRHRGMLDGQRVTVRGDGYNLIVCPIGSDGPMLVVEGADH